MPCRSVYLSFPCCCTPIISEWDNTSEHLMSSHWSPHSCPTVYQHLHHVGYPSASFLTFGCSVISSSSTVVIKWCIIHTIQSSIFKLVDFILYYHHKYWFQGTHKHFSPSPKTQKRGISVEHKIKSCVHMTQWGAKLEILDRCPGTQWALADMYWGLQAV